MKSYLYLFIIIGMFAFAVSYDGREPIGFGFNGDYETKEFPTYNKKTKENPRGLPKFRYIDGRPVLMNPDMKAVTEFDIKAQNEFRERLRAAN